MKTANNKDYEDLFKIYAESSCAYNKKPEDDEEDEDKKVVEEDEEEDEEDEDVVEEGILDDTKSFINRQKSRIGSAKDTVKQGVQNFKGTGKRQDLSKKYRQGKQQRIFQNHMDRINSSLSSLVSDLVKMGLSDPDEAEKSAQRISDEVSKIISVENLGKGVNQNKRNFDREQGDAARQYQ